MSEKQIWEQIELPREEALEMRAIEAELQVIELQIRMQFFQHSHALIKRKQELIAQWEQKFGLKPGVAWRLDYEKGILLVPEIAHQKAE